MYGITPIKNAYFLRFKRVLLKKFLRSSAATGKRSCIFMAHKITNDCIGCGACAAACKNGSAMLFVSAKVSQLALLPQGKVEAARRAKAMLAKMDELGFGNCTNTRACEAECPKCISISNIARLNREFIAAKLKD